MTTKKITLGSGYLYVYPYDGHYMPTAAEIEHAEYLIGYIKDGCTVKYEQELADVIDYDNEIAATVLVSDSFILRAGIINWDINVLAKIVQAAQKVSDTEVKIGGPTNSTERLYVVHFKHYEGQKRVTFIGLNTSSLELAFQKASAAVVSMEFRAHPMEDGRLFIMTDTTVTPTTTKTITANGTYNIVGYDTAIVNVPLPDWSLSTARPSDVAENKFFYYNGTLTEGTLNLVRKDTITITPDYTVEDPTYAIFHLDATEPSFVNITEDATIKLPLSALGDANRSDVAQGKTFSSVHGLFNTGSATASIPGYNGVLNKGETTTELRASTYWKVLTMNVNVPLANVTNNQLVSLQIIRIKPTVTGSWKYRVTTTMKTSSGYSTEVTEYSTMSDAVSYSSYMTFVSSPTFSLKLNDLDTLNNNGYRITVDYL